MAREQQQPALEIDERAVRHRRPELHRPAGVVPRAVAPLGHEVNPRGEPILVERLAVIVQFLAVLELCKQGLVDLEQGSLFGDLHVSWIGGADGHTEAVRNRGLIAFGKLTSPTPWFASSSSSSSIAASRS